MTSPTPEWQQRCESALAIIREHLRPTPLVRIDLAGFDAPAFLKLETMQPTGSFKVRGALAAVAASARHGRPVVTASAGNHGLGIAFAATLLGADATVVVPRTASEAKIAALRRYAIDLRLIGDGYDAAEAAALELSATSDAFFISAYTDPDVIAGQASIVREVADEMTGPGQIVVPVGGGGLASGTSLAAPDRARVIGVEAAASRAVSSAMTAREIIEVAIDETLADGLAGNIASGTITPQILLDGAVTMATVSEEAIAAAVKELALQHGIVAEGSAVVGIAAARTHQVPPNLPTVFVISGRNIAADRLATLLRG